MKVEVYGVDHSPWVQAVLLTLHEKGIEHTLRQLPPLEAFRRWGVFMPAVSIDGAPWEIESTQILVKLGFDPISDEDLHSVQGAWQGVQHRTDNPLRFFSAFAHAGDTSPSLYKRSMRNFLRSFIPFYMFLLISMYKWKLKPVDPDNYADQYLVWERTLESSNGLFLDGDAPGIRDMLLFGIVQCHSSIPVPPLDPLRSDERLAGLRQWLTSMHEQFRGYPHLYSGACFEPYLPQPAAASPLQRGIFYLGLLTMIVAFPVTVPLAFVLMSKAPR
jgi:glutathione S-transferase